MPANPDPRTLPLYARLLAWIIAWRVELGAAIAVTAGRVMLARATDAATADYAMVVTIAAILSVRWTRWWLKDKLVGARRRRRWEQGLAWMWPAPATPRLHAHGTGPWGEWAQVRTGPGGTVADLAARADALAAWLGVIEVRVHPSATSAGWATLHALVADPLARPAGPWPWANAASTSLWQPVPVGIDEAGAPVAIGLFEHNLLLGGEPGAGKSVALSQLVAAAALDPGASLWLLDGKLVELAAWKPCAAGSAGLDVSDATAVLRAVQTIMDSRYQGLLASGQRKVAAGTGIHVVVVDELAHYLTWPDKKPRDAFADVLRDLVSRGRAAGIVVLAATQKPSSDVIPTSLRDLFGYRWALRCTTGAASDTILGTGWAAQGISAAGIAPANRGVGWLLHESGTPARLRAHHLDDEAIAAIAERAATLRQETIRRQNTVRRQETGDG